MQTPTHLLVAVAVLLRKGETTPRRTAAVLGGALLPDAAIFVMFFWERLIVGVSEAELWSRIYWQSPWQDAVIIGNSMPLFALLVLVGWRWGVRWLWMLGVAALLHLVLDFPVHADDAHVHFWPFSDWRFHSPFSYWDRAHHGGVVALIELLLSLGCMAVIWRRFPSRWVGGAMLACAIGFVGVPVYFSLMLG